MKAKLIATVTVALALAVAAFAVEIQRSAKSVAFDYNTAMPAQNKTALERSTSGTSKLNSRAPTMSADAPKNKTLRSISVSPPR